MQRRKTDGWRRRYNGRHPATMLTTLPPLSLYIHLPWCVRKCPYCDFNSHALRDEIPAQTYVDALIRDLEHDLPRVWGRRVQTIFIGGGTPSLFDPAHIDALLAGVRARIAVSANAEITLEANPGTVDAARFAGYRTAGVNRLSIGIQSFNDGHLSALGRIHGRAEALRAATAARAAGFDNFNLDLMYGLPGQTLAEALADIDAALAFSPPHVSAYQLTLEPNTEFHRRPPALPDDDAVADMHAAIAARLAEAGFAHYEVSAYARAGHACRHNLNYWTFGDYLGIGAGAHAKISAAHGVVRLAKTRAPKAFMQHAGSANAVASEQRIDASELPFEFMLNGLRLHAGVALADFEQRTGLARAAIAPMLAAARERGLLEPCGDEAWRPTALGQRFLNDLIALFLPARAA